MTEMAHFKTRQAWERIVVSTKPGPTEIHTDTTSLAKMNLNKHPPAIVYKKSVSRKGLFVCKKRSQVCMDIFQLIYISISNIRLNCLLTSEFRKLIR